MGTTDFARPEQRFGYVIADVRVTDVAMEIGARDKPRGLMTCAAQEERATGCMKCLREFLECAQASRIERGHVPEPQDDDRRKRVNVIENWTQFVGGSE